MRVYRNYTAKKLKLPKRILFFVICAVVIFIFAIILGNHLKSRMENAELDRTPVETTPPKETSVPDGIADGDAEHSQRSAEVKAGYLGLTGADDETAIKEKVDALKAEGFNAVSFISVADGKLCYASAAAEEYSRLPSSADIVSPLMLAEAVSYAEGQGMTSSVLLVKGQSEELDMAVAAELAEIGFDEIVISGFEDLLGEKGGGISSCIDYLRKLRATAEGVHISLRLSTDAFTYARNSYQIEKLFTYCEFLSLDITELEADAVAELANKITGSISAYMIRPFISGDKEGVAEAIEAEGGMSYQYVSARSVPDASDTETDADGNPVIPEESSSDER